MISIFAGWSRVRRCRAACWRSGCRCCWPSVWLAYVAASPPADYLQLALWSFALAAAGLFPALVLAVWWKRANRWGALLGMLAGFAVAAYLIAAASFYPQLSAYLEQAGLADIVRSLGRTGLSSRRFRPALSWRSWSALRPRGRRARHTPIRRGARPATRFSRRRRARIAPCLSQRLDQRRRAHHVTLAKGAARRRFFVEAPVLDVPVLVDMGGRPHRFRVDARRPRRPAPAAPSR